MPVSISWKEMYRLEYEQLRREGFAPDGTHEKGREQLPVATAVKAQESITQAEESMWKQAYQRLLLCQNNGLRADFSYVEPNSLKDILAQADPVPTLQKLPDAWYPDRILGAWNGRFAGVLLGKPLEMGYTRLQVKEYLESIDGYPLRDYVPLYSEKLNRTLREDCIASSRGHIEYVQSDDDIHYTICSLLLMEKYGANFSLWDAAQNLLENLPYHWVWTADRALYSNLVHMNEYDPPEVQCMRMGDCLNPWRESMCPQLKADFWGYITPGEVRRGAEMIHRLGYLSARKNGLYGGMFLQGCVSGALSANPTPISILRCGLANIPHQSRLHEAIERVITWHCQLQKWELVCDAIEHHYGDWYFAGAINNLCLIALSLLEGNLDYERSITTAVMCGTDTDCNAGNVGSIVGAAIGMNALPKHWIAPLNNSVHSAVAGFGFGTITELANRTLAQRVRLM